MPGRSDGSDVYIQYDMLVPGWCALVECWKREKLSPRSLVKCHAMCERLRLNNRRCTAPRELSDG
jgi:hypothetical protein